MRRSQRWALALVALASGSMVPSARAAPEPGVVLRSAKISGLEARTAALLLTGEEAGDLAASLLSIPLPADHGRSRVTLIVEIGADSLLEGGEADLVTAEIYAYALDRDGAVAAHLTEGFAIDRAAHYGPLLSEGLRYVGHLEVSPGSYSLRVLLSSRQTGRFALLVQPLEVPVWTGPGPAASQPFISEAARGVIVRQEDGPEPEPESALALAQAARVRPVFAADEVAHLLLAARGLTEPPIGEVLDREGVRAASFRWRALSAAARAPGVDLYRAELSLADLEPGAYEVETVGASGSPRFKGSLGFSVSSPAAELPQVPEPAGARADLSGDLGSDYIEALRALANGDRATAIHRLTAIQLTALGGGAERREPLIETVLSVASRLTEGDAERLVPLIELHDDMYRRFHRDRRYLAATQSRRLVQLLAEMYTEKSSSADANAILACTRVSRAAYLLQVGSLAPAEGSFRAALDHSRDHEAALLGWAIVREAFGDYENATRMLQQLLDVSPLHEEARLRLAVNLRRQGATQRAARLFRELLEPEVEPWVGIIAHQELADLLLGGRQASGAVRLLGEAIERWPHVERLYIQLSAALDRLGRPIEAQAAIERLTSAPRDSAPSARFRYARWPEELLRRDRRYLEDAAADRYPSLAEALTSGIAKGS